MECDDVIRKGDIDKHMILCPYTQVICPNSSICGLLIRRDLDEHKNNICPYRIVECFLTCGLMLPLADMQDHIQSECLKSPVQCKNNCGEQIERGVLEKHINHDCPLEIIDCPNRGESLFEEGCTVRLKRKDIESHKVTCNFRRIYCQNLKCNQIIIYKDLQSHDERCLFKVIECENKCGLKVQRQNLDKHKEVCEFQLVKCPYYNLGCKIEILRKDYKQHLHEESFNHSIIFIEGQKKKNREIDELKHEIVNLKKDYEVEIQMMFFEINRVKEEINSIKGNKGHQQQQQCPQQQPQYIMPQYMPAYIQKKEDRKYDLNAPKYPYMEGINVPGQIQQPDLSRPDSRRLGYREGSNLLNSASVDGGQYNLNNPGLNSYGAGSSLSNSQPAHFHNLHQQRLGLPSQQLLNQQYQRNANKPPLMGRPLMGTNDNIQNMYGEQMSRVRGNQERSEIGNLSERKNPLVMFLGSMNASNDSGPGLNPLLNANHGGPMHQSWNDVAQQVASVLNEDWPSTRARGSRRMQGPGGQANDLDSSNVLYDEDFEIEEEKFSI